MQGSSLQGDSLQGDGTAPPANSTGYLFSMRGLSLQGSGTYGFFSLIVTPVTANTDTGTSGIRTFVRNIRHLLTGGAGRGPSVAPWMPGEE